MKVFIAVFILIAFALGVGLTVKDSVYGKKDTTCEAYRDSQARFVPARCIKNFLIETK